MLETWRILPLGGADVSCSGDPGEAVFGGEVDYGEWFLGKGAGLGMGVGGKFIIFVQINVILLWKFVQIIRSIFEYKLYELKTWVKSYRFYDQKMGKLDERRSEEWIKVNICIEMD